ncbi:YLP motif-containing protein 1-like [Antechinus flavipes]|uniref:YLP motif-containing protein 1-like n=1 Tax=Antechinus flavipes TaxID=38775 RepID=UPI00223564FF|nr:YLP motif-containing protein 1-like [Antechinus flavipes]
MGGPPPFEFRLDPPLLWPWTRTSCPPEPLPPRVPAPQSPCPPEPLPPRIPTLSTKKLPKALRGQLRNPGASPPVLPLPLWLSRAPLHWAALVDAGNIWPRFRAAGKSPRACSQVFATRKPEPSAGLFLQERENHIYSPCARLILQIVPMIFTTVLGVQVALSLSAA